MKLKEVLSYFLLVFLFINTSCDLKDNSVNNYYTVTRVIDGDTFVIDDGTKKGRKIRLIGIDAPETKNTRKKKKGFHSKEAKSFLTELIKSKQVFLEYDIQLTDRYGRTLAYAYLTDGTFVNAELVKQGHTQIATFPPNVKYADLFLSLQQEARDNNRGLWKK